MIHRHSVEKNSREYRVPYLVVKGFDNQSPSLGELAWFFTSIHTFYFKYGIIIKNKILVLILYTWPYTYILLAYFGYFVSFIFWNFVYFFLTSFFLKVVSYKVSFFAFLNTDFYFLYNIICRVSVFWYYSRYNFLDIYKDSFDILVPVFIWRTYFLLNKNRYNLDLYLFDVDYEIHLNLYFYIFYTL